MCVFLQIPICFVKYVVLMHSKASNRSRGAVHPQIEPLRVPPGVATATEFLEAGTYMSCWATESMAMNGKAMP